MREPRKVSRYPQLTARTLGKAASRVPGQGSALDVWDLLPSRSRCHRAPF